MPTSRTDPEAPEERRGRVFLVLEATISLVTVLAVVTYPVATAAVVILGALPYAFLSRTHRSYMSGAWRKWGKSPDDAFMLSLITAFAMIDSTAANIWFATQPHLPQGTNEQRED